MRCCGVIYTDAASVLTRHWNHRDADRTKVTPVSSHIVFLLETTQVSGFGPAVDAAAADLAGAASRAHSVTTHFITRQIPAVLLTR